MGQSSSENESSAPEALALKQCPYCGHNNKYKPSEGAPGQCDDCERKFADPMEARAAYEAMFDRRRRRKLRDIVEGFFAGHSVRLVLLGVALGTVLGKFGRWLWES